MMQPLVSVVTPSFNQGVFIERTIRSVLSQDYPNVEYIVLDACSTDETSDILRTYSDRIDTIITAPDEGQADAIDKGFKLCHGSIIAYLNSDDCYASTDVISSAVRHLQQNESADLVYGRRVFIDEAGFFQDQYPFAPYNKERLLQSDYIPQECCFWRREIYERAGGFVDKALRFAMDYDLWLRFIAAGADFLAVDETYGLFRNHASAKSTELFQTVGLAEIALMQSRYLPRALSESEMSNVWGIHHTGFERESRKLFKQVWSEFVTLKKDLNGEVPLDIWMMPPAKPAEAKVS